MIRISHRLPLALAFFACALGAVVLDALPVTADDIPLMKKREAEMAFDRGRAALTNNDLAAADAAFTESIKLDPRIVGALLGLAQVAAKRGDEKGYAANLERARVIGEDSPEVQRDWGRYKYSQGQFAEAETAFRKAITLNPGGTGARVDLADMYAMALRKRAEAIELYREVLAIDPHHAGAAYALGMILADSGDAAGAIKALNDAAKLSPGNPLPYYQLGRVQETQKHWDAALDALGHALQIQPSYAGALFERGQVRVAQHDAEAAIEDFGAAVHAEPKFVTAQVSLGMVYQERRQWTEAEGAYRNALKVDSKQPIALNNLAWMAADRKTELDEALTWARQAAAIAPNVSQFKTTLGWVYRARGDLAKAGEALDQAAHMKPERAEAFYYLGVVRLEQARRADAVAALQHALALDATFANAADARQRLKTLGAK